MKTNLILFFLIIAFIPMYGQKTIEKLEEDLLWRKSSEKEGGKIDKAYTLQKIDPFNEIAIEYILRYYQREKIDSISIFFDNLIKSYPNSPIPYLIRSEFLYMEHDFRDKKNYNKWKIQYLNLALNLDRSNKFTLYSLAETFYKDFMYSREKEKDYGFVFDDFDSLFSKHKKEIKKSSFEHSADSALNYFYDLWNIDSTLKDVIYFPIRQLECYLNKDTDSPIKVDLLSISNYCFFPPWYFANLSTNWECDSTIDYLFDIKFSKRGAEWISLQLTNLKETCLYNQNLSYDSAIFRFTWLRSFDEPICIRLNQDNEGAYLFWKIGKGAGGYEPKGLKKSKKRKLTLNEWNEFAELFNNLKFDSLPNDKYLPMTDGATWTLEHKVNDKFKAHNTNMPNKEFKECCLFLLKLTGITMEKENIY